MPAQAVSWWHHSGVILRSQRALATIASKAKRRQARHTRSKRISCGITHLQCSAGTKNTGTDSRCSKGGHTLATSSYETRGSPRVSATQIRDCEKQAWSVARGRRINHTDPIRASLVSGTRVCGGVCGRCTLSFPITWWWDAERCAYSGLH